MLKNDFEEQGLILKNKFKEKGYEDTHIEEAFQKYLQLYQNTCAEGGKMTKYDGMDEHNHK